MEALVPERIGLDSSSVGQDRGVAVQEEEAAHEGCVAQAFPVTGEWHESTGEREVGGRRRVCGMSAATTKNRSGANDGTALWLEINLEEFVRTRGLLREATAKRRRLVERAPFHH